MAIFFNKRLDYKIRRKIIDENGNFIILDLKVHTQRLSFINLYGPNKDNPDFLKIISNYIDEIGNTDIIICGDYNCVLNPDLDYYNYKCLNNRKAREEVLDIITRVLQKVLSLGSDYFSATFYQTYFYCKPSKYSPFTETHFCYPVAKSR